MNITIVGLGVIGGSYALSLKETNHSVFGIDINEQSLVKAKKAGVIKKGAIINTDNSKKIIENTDILVLCIYPENIINFIKENKEYFKKGTILTDVTGIKTIFVDKIMQLLPEYVDFVFSHPMAGREKKGFEYASAQVFQNANFLITPTKKNKEKNIQMIESLAKQMGFSTIKRVDYKKHDDIVSFVSQLPHVLSVALVNSECLNVDIKDFTGDSYREFTRIANINEELWSQLFLGNKENLINKIENFQEELEAIKLSLYNDDKDTLKKVLKASTKKFENLV